MSVLPIYKKIFTRDFTLATVEIWVRPETTNPKIWTTERQPYQPYIVVEGAKGRISAFYDPRGILWMKQLLKKFIQENPSFLDSISLEYLKGYTLLKDIYSKQSILSEEVLVKFLTDAESAWTWFEALWWIWELTPEEKKDVTLPDKIFTLRENTQEIVPEIERVVRSTLSHMYPELGDLIEVLSVEEIKTRKIPDVNILQKRHEGYFFVDNTLLVGKDRAYIKDKYHITFESLVVSDKGIVRGQSAFKGVVKGRVKIVYGPKDTNKVLEGDVIVAPMTMPDVMPAMKKAVAFVTDEGGVMCHAAIIAREMKKPCVIGTKFATEVFKDGDLVEVDAERGVVTVLKRNE